VKNERPSIKPEDIETLSPLRLATGANCPSCRVPYNGVSHQWVYSASLVGGWQYRRYVCSRQCAFEELRK